MKGNIDILILARPDHSYTIYKGLLGRSLSYIYCSFKLMPQWLRRFIKNPRVRYYTDNYSNCKLLTLFHIWRTKYNRDDLEKYEQNLFEFHLKQLLKKVSPRIIHYWPHLTYNTIKPYKQKHPEIKTYADLYFPCEHWVIENIQPVLESYGLGENKALQHSAERLREFMKFEDNFIVPSPFMADTYRQYYPNKNYVIIPYGVTVWERYKKKGKKETTNEIRRFVYAGGGVTIQKGCDLMLEYFEKHPGIELHIYGSIPQAQNFIFEKYRECSNIYFYGHVPKSKLQEEISQYDVGIHLSRYDAYSLAVGEIMGAGLPVIVSDKTGSFSIVEEKGAGCVASLNLDDIHRAISEIRKPYIYNKCVDKLDEYLLSNKDKYPENLIEFYKTLL